MATEKIQYEEVFIDAGTIQSATDKALSKVDERYPRAEVENLNANAKHTIHATTGNAVRTDVEVTIELARRNL